MQEPRRFIRVQAQLPVTYRVLPSPAKVRSMTCDVAGSGLSLLVQEPLARGAQLQLEIWLPAPTRALGGTSGPDRDQPVMATGEVMWCEHHRLIGKTGQQTLIKTGVRFLHLDSRDQDAMLQYVASHLPST